ncbi:MAG: DUF4175 family protein, partial [Alphaproteobacteria bacterium]|nr:DUF4175 family protein [Alphaproteobacteria bacterium]
MTISQIIKKFWQIPVLLVFIVSALILIRLLNPNFLTNHGFSVRMWIIPPAYTGKKSFLTDNYPPDTQIPIEAGSTVLCLVHSKGRPSLLINEQERLFNILGDSSYRIETTIDKVGKKPPAIISVMINDAHAVEYPIKFIEDKKPSIDFKTPPEIDNKWQLNISSAISDDYGVVSAFAEIRSLTYPEKPPVKLALPLNTTSSFHNLKTHKLLDMDITIQLKAYDAKKQVGVSRKHNVHIPTHNFRNETSYKLDKLRKDIEISHTLTSKTEAELLNLINEHKKSKSDIGVYLALTTAKSRLLTNGSKHGIDSVLNLLWEAAMRLDNNKTGTIQQIEYIIQSLDIKFKNRTERKLLLSSLSSATEQYLLELSQKSQNDRIIKIKQLLRRLSAVGILGTEKAVRKQVYALKNELIGLDSANITKPNEAELKKAYEIFNKIHLLSVSFNKSD